MSQENSSDSPKDEISKLDDLRAKLEELVSKTEPHIEEHADYKSSFPSTKSSESTKTDKSVIALQAKLESRIRTIETSLGEIQSRMDDSVFNSFAESFKAKMHILEQRLNVDEKIKVIRKDILQATEEATSSAESKVNIRVNVLENRLIAISEQNKDMLSTIQFNMEERVKDYDKASKDTALRVREAILLLQKRVEGDLEGIKKDMTEAGSKPADAMRIIETQMNGRVTRFEKKMDEVINQSVAAIARMEGELESRINQLESKNRELINKSQEPISLVREKLSGEINQLKEQLEFLDSREKETAQNTDVKFDLKLGGLESLLENLSVQSMESLSRVQGSLESKFNQFESRNKELISKTLDTIGGLESRIGQELGHIRQEFTEQQSRASDGLKKGFEEKLSALNNQWSESLKTNLIKMDERASGLERAHKDFAALAGDSVTSLEKKMDGEIARLRESVEGFFPRVEELLKNSQSEFNAHSEQMESKLGEVTKRLDENHALVQGELESKLNQFEAKYKEIITRTAQAVTALQVSIESDLHRVHEEVKDMSDRVTRSEEFFKKEIRERILEEASWNQLAQRITASMNDLDLKVNQSFLDTAKRQQQMLASKFRQGFLVFCLVSVFLFGGMYLTVMGQAKGFLQSLGETFSSGQGKNILLNAAVAKVPEVLHESAKPVFDLIKTDINNRMTEFQTYLDEQKSKITDDQLMLSSEIVMLEERNRLMQLEDEAVHQGSRKAYEDLKEYIQVTAQPQLAQTAQASLERIKSFYNGESRVQKFSLTFKGPSNFEYRDDSIPITALFSYLRHDEDWKVRAKSAELLRPWRKQGVPEVLLEAVKADKNLDVVRSAMRSFEALTGFKSEDIFAVDQAQTWWEQNKKTVTQGLAEK